MSLKVLLVQTKAQSVRALNRYLKTLDAEVGMTFDLGEAATRLASQEYNLMILDLGFPGTEWQDFLAIVRAEYPKMKVMLTSTSQDRERELLAQEMGVSTVLRQPFTEYWIQRDLQALGLAPLEQTSDQSIAPLYNSPQVGVPLGLKLTLPFLIIVLLVALGSAAIAASYFNRQSQAGFDAQMGSAGKLASTWMTAQENQMVQTLRLVANAQNVSSLVQSGDSEGLRLLILPVAANSDEETIEILDAHGLSLLSLRKTPEDLPGLYDAESGDTFFQQADFVKQALQSGAGARTTGFARAPWGNYFYVCSPITDSDGAVIGAALIGRSPTRMASQLQAETLADVTFYDTSGQPLASTLFTGADSYPLDLPVLQQAVANQPGQGLTRNLQVGKAQYSEILSPWQSGSGLSLGTYGLALQRSPLVNLSNLNLTEILSFLAAAILIVILIGLLLANSTTSRVRQLTQSSSEIAAGNLNAPIDTEGSDEFSTLAKSIKQMVEGLQERALTRDVLGHSFTPDLREELRKSMALQHLRLEGQEMTVTVLKTNLFGFQDLLEKTDPVQVFEWLNDYYNVLAPVVHQHDGIIHRLEGSAMTAYFGILPPTQSVYESTAAACDAAAEMLQALRAFNATRDAAGEPQMKTSIAIHTGQVVAGGLGYGEKLDYALAGEAVKSVSALADLTPMLSADSQAYLSQAAATALNESVDAYPLEPIAIRERNDPASQRYIYRLLSRLTTGETEVDL